MAASVVIAIALPALGSILRPYVTVAVVLLLGLAFLRMDFSAFKAHLRRPQLVIAATAWTCVVIPLLAGVSALALGVDERAPDLFLALVLQATASPMMAGPALAALMGLDATLVLAALITSSAIVPLTAPLLTFLFLGAAHAISPLELGIKLLAILGGAGVLGICARRLVGRAAIERRKEAIDGLNIVVLFVFVAAVMSSVGARFLESPWAMLALAALAFVVFFALLFLTALLFRRAGRERALLVALVASQRNLGLMIAGSGGTLPELTWVYFALSQFPIYLAPQFLQPWARRVREPVAARRGPRDRTS